MVNPIQSIWLTVSIAQRLQCISTQNIAYECMNGVFLRGKPNHVKWSSLGSSVLIENTTIYKTKCTCTLR